MYLRNHHKLLTVIFVSLFFIINFSNKKFEYTTNIEFKKGLERLYKNLKITNFSNNDDTKQKLIKDTTLVKFFDLSGAIVPNTTYDQIPCRKSALIIVETTLCVHTIKNDVYVSGSIWNNGVWEENILSEYLK